MEWTGKMISEKISDISIAGTGMGVMSRSRVRPARRHGLGSMVFDGARAFEGVAPDLDRH